jgi:sugar lactone lactonase YvrE
MRSSAWVLPLACLLPLVLTGCTLSTTAPPTPDAGLAITGSVHGGQSPIVGAHVYLLAANAGVFTPNVSGYGNASLSLLKSVSGQTTLDTSGGPTNGDYYVTSDSNGNFAITGDYTCVGGQQVYMYSLGGNPGLGSGSNAASGLLAALGTCPGSVGGNHIFSSGLYVVINEVSTVAAAYSFAGFATDAVHVSSSGTAAAKLGIANAFVNAAILETLSTGMANAAPPPGVGYFGGGGSVPQTTVNTLGNILAACVNSSSSSSTACTGLFSNTTNGSTQPTDTATAAINIAHNPAANVTALYGLSSAYAQFAPALTAQPNDFTLAIYYNAGTPGSGPVVADASGNIWWSDTVVDEVNHEGYDPTPSNFINGNTGYAVPYYPAAIALDVNGDLWSVNGNDGAGAPSLNELTPAGATGSGSPFTGLGITNPTGLALDASSNSWVTNSASPGAVIKATSAGALSGTFTAGGIVSPQAIAIDPSGNAWIADGANAIIKLSSTGSPLSGTSGYTGIGLNSPKAIAIDHSGNVWVANNGGNNVIVISSTGGAVSGSAGYTAASLSQPSAIAIDGSGNAWVKGIGVNQDAGNYTITELSNSGVVLSGANGFFSTSSGGIAIDESGDVWTNYAYVQVLFSTTWYVEELIGAATPVVTPLSVGVMNNTLGTRP